jgi:K+ transporter
MENVANIASIYPRTLDNVFGSEFFEIFEGGFVPLGLGLMTVMVSWRWGMDRINSMLRISSKETVGELFSERENNDSFVSRSVFIVSENAIKTFEDRLPPLNGIYLSKYELLPEHLIYLTVVTHQEAEMKKRRLEVYPLDIDPKHGTIVSAVVNLDLWKKLI